MEGPDALSGKIGEEIRRLPVSYPGRVATNTSYGSVSQRIDRARRCRHMTGHCRCSATNDDGLRRVTQ